MNDKRPFLCEVSQCGFGKKKTFLSHVALSESKALAVLDDSYLLE